MGHTLEPASDVRSSRAFAAEHILNRMFNWTISLSRNATIYKKFGYFYKKNDTEILVTPPKEIFVHSNRSKDYCWIISNCGQTFHNDRNKIVQSLIGSLSSKVHIWGAATKRGCVNGKHPNVVDHGLTTEGLRSHLGVPQTLLKDCKFYFAFENSNCTDFVTTRFITSVVAGAVPIVLGRLDTYNEMPPGSFVHLSQFGSITELAKHLDSLARSEEKLKSYHEWRKYYRYEQTGAEAACKLCRKLEKLKRARLAGEEIIPSMIPNLAKHYAKLEKCTPIKSPPL